jgi:cysteine-rich repeat protein
MLAGCAGCSWQLGYAAPGTGGSGEVDDASGGAAAERGDGEAAGSGAGDGSGGSDGPFASAPVCGDGRVDAGEACDDGNDVEADACRSDCTAARCGDGVWWAGVEGCDDGNEVETDDCLSSCVVAFCGDGFVQAGVEGCDDGNGDGSDACLGDCQPATCGDGVVWVGVEQCDDADDDDLDACGDCTEQRKVFVTSEQFMGDLGGVSGADLRCMVEASAAGLPGEFRAWISAPGEDAFVRIGGQDFAGRYVLVDGTFVSHGGDDLIDGELHHPIDRDPFGGPAFALVWTGTDASGASSDYPETCFGWQEFLSAGRAGESHGFGPWWTFAVKLPCDETAALYCFEVESGW